MIPTQQELIKKASQVPSAPIAIEAFWDGDTDGWYIILTMIYHHNSQENSRRFKEYDLACMRGSGGDLRIFNGLTPPWPEAQFATQVGEELAKKFGVPFFFASPNYPEDDCPRWWERDKAYPCRRCGIQLLQRETCSWVGICYSCHLAEEYASSNS